MSGLFAESGIHMRKGDSAESGLTSARSDWFVRGPPMPMVLALTSTLILALNRPNPPSIGPFVAL